MKKEIEKDAIELMSYCLNSNLYSEGYHSKTQDKLDTLNTIQDIGKILTVIFIITLVILVFIYFVIAGKQKDISDNKSLENSI